MPRDVHIFDKYSERHLTRRCRAVQAWRNDVAVTVKRRGLRFERAAGFAVAFGVVVAQLPLSGRKPSGVATLGRGHGSSPPRFALAGCRAGLVTSRRILPGGGRRPGLVTLLGSRRPPYRRLAGTLRSPLRGSASG